MGEMPLENPASLIVCDSCFWNRRLLWCSFVDVCLLPRAGCLLSGLGLPAGGAFFLAEYDGRCASSFGGLALDADCAAA